MAERPAPLVLISPPVEAESEAERDGGQAPIGEAPIGEAPFGSYVAVAVAGRQLLADELSQRLAAQGAAVARLVVDHGEAPGTFAWGAWFVDGARAVLAQATADGRGVDAVGYAGAGAMALAPDQLLDELLSPIHGEVVANNRFSADAFVVAGDLERALDALAGCESDNAAVRCLEEAGFRSREAAGKGTRGGWSRFDVDTPLDLALLRVAAWLPGTRRLDHGVAGFLEMATLPRGGLEVPRLAEVGEVVRDRRAELVVAGRMPSAMLGYLETETACRVRAFVEERGMRSAPDGRPRSLLAGWAERLGPGELVRELASLGDAVVLDSRVLMAARAGSSEDRAWPPAEERFASDFLDPARVGTPWLAELTQAAAASSTPVLLGGHALVSDGLRILVEAAWLGR